MQTAPGIPLRLRSGASKYANGVRHPSKIAIRSFKICKWLQASVWNYSSDRRTMQTAANIPLKLPSGASKYVNGSSHPCKMAVRSIKLCEWLRASLKNCSPEHQNMQMASGIPFKVAIRSARIFQKIHLTLKNTTSHIKNTVGCKKYHLTYKKYHPRMKKYPRSC